MELVKPSPLVAQARALQERLALLFPPPAFQHEFVPAKLTGDTWLKLTTQTPFVGLGWSLADARGAASNSFNGGVRWVVFLVVKNQAGGFAPRFLGDKFGDGLLDLVGAAIAGLHGWTIPGIGTVQVTSAGNAYSDDWAMENGACAMIEADVKTSLPIPDVFTGADVKPNEFKTLVSNWRFDRDPAFQIVSEPSAASHHKDEDHHGR